MLALLFLLAVLGTGMAALGTVWSTMVQREKEAELLFIGAQFSQALESYHRISPDHEKTYPQTLDALVLDPRFPMPVRHLRRVYTDPMTGTPEWGLIRDAQGGIIGVHSLSEAAPLKVSGFPPGQEAFAEAASYRDWVFKARPPEQQPAEAESIGREAVAGQSARSPRPARGSLRGSDADQ